MERYFFVFIILEKRTSLELYLLLWVFVCEGDTHLWATQLDIDCCQRCLEVCCTNWGPRSFNTRHLAAGTTTHGPFHCIAPPLTSGAQSCCRGHLNRLTVKLSSQPTQQRDFPKQSHYQYWVFVSVCAQLLPICTEGWWSNWAGLSLQFLSLQGPCHYFITNI